MERIRNSMHEPVEGLLRKKVYQPIYSINKGAIDFHEHNSYTKIGEHFFVFLLKGLSTRKPKARHLTEKGDG